MFRCFCDCMIRPKFISNHLNMKTGKFILYVILMILLMSVPIYATYFFNLDVSSNISSYISEDLRNSGTKVPYKIENNRLVSTIEDQARVTAIDLPSCALFVVKTYLVFNPNDQDIIIENQSALLIVLNSEKVDLVFNSGNNSGTTDGIQQLANQNAVLRSYSYEEIKAEGLNFNEVMNYSNYSFQFSLATIIDNMIKPYLYIIHSIAIPSILISSTISLLFDTLLISLIVSLFFRMWGLKFKTIFQLVMLCMTPSAVLGILRLLPLGTYWYFGIMILGQILTIIYFYIAIRQIAMKNIYTNNNQ